MLVDQLRRAFAAQQQRKCVEPGDDALQLDALDEENRDRQLRPPDAVEEMVLEAQGFAAMMTGRLFLALPLVANPSAFNFRCSAERSMPMNDAVREMLPEKRRI